MDAATQSRNNPGTGAAPRGKPARSSTASCAKLRAIDAELEASRPNASSIACCRTLRCVRGAQRESAEPTVLGRGARRRTSVEHISPRARARRRSSRSAWRDRGRDGALIDEIDAAAGTRLVPRGRRLRGAGGRGAAQARMDRRARDRRASRAAQRCMPGRAAAKTTGASASRSPRRCSRACCSR